MTFKKYIHLPVIQESKIDKCKTSWCNNRISERKRASLKGHSFLFCSRICENRFYKYEYDLRRVLKYFRLGYKVTNRSLIGKRGSWRQF